MTEMHIIRKLPWNTLLKCQRKYFSQALRQNSRCMCTMKPPGERSKEMIDERDPKLCIPKGILGQPTCHTHPHLIKKGFLTCGITQMEYKERRDTLVNTLVSEVENDHICHFIVIPAAQKQYMSDKIPYVFRQNSDFFYLTGCMEPEAVLVIEKLAQSSNYKTIMFVHEKDKYAELWEGPRTGCHAALELFAVDESRPVETFSNYINKMKTTRASIVWYQNEGCANPELSAPIGAAVAGGRVTRACPQRALHGMRVRKSPAEIELMQRTCDIGARAINTAMACTKPGISEHSVNAILEFSCRQAGAEHLAFPPVVAGGPRATHIHYVANNQLLRGDEMLLVDSGSQRWLYNSDISRTWPVSGKFSPYHKILYELVLTVQKRLIELLGEHRPPLDQLFDQMCRLLGVHLQQEGILPKSLDGNELIAKAYRLCPHHVSHYLGLDVHDAPLVRRGVPVQPGMVVTVEPGIYIREEDTTVPPEFRGVGIRIEDDVLVTEGAPRVLTAACLKEVADIEAAVGTADP